MQGSYTENLFDCSCTVDRDLDWWVESVTPILTNWDQNKKIKREIYNLHNLPEMLTEDLKGKTFILIYSCSWCEL